MTEQILLVPINELKLLMTDVVNDCLQHKIPGDTTLQTEIISRDELCKRLNISPPTAIRWSKKKLIPCFRIGSSIRYNWPKVIEALEKKGGSK
jgi:hypothetical protein